MEHQSTVIYSCDDHLDLSAVPPGLWESRLSAADAARGPRVVKREHGSVWVCEDAVMGRSGMPPNARVREEVQRDRAGRHRRRRVPRRDADVAARRTWIATAYRPR